jgi:fatty-acyl-CoA synthase
MAASGLLIGELLRRNGEAVPGRVAASQGGDLLTHGELDAAANRGARVLREWGVRKGDRVVCWADGSLDILVLFAACAKAGAVFAPLNSGYSAAEAEAPMHLVRARLLVTDAAHAEAGAELCLRSGIEQLARLDAGCEAGVSLPLASRRVSSAPFSCEGLVEDDPQVIFFTSGSTGAPKGVVLSHRVNHLRTTHGVFRDVPERSVCMFPLFHMAPFTLALSAWQTRGEIVLVPKPTADALLDAVVARCANRLYCIPAVWARILERDTSAWDTSSLRELDTGTSATPVELLRSLKERFPHAALRVYYGSTEVGAGTLLGDADVLSRPGSVGLPAAGVDLALGEGGEILIRSPYLFDGYFDDPESTAAALADGWFHTGDRGVRDADGYLSVVGRLKELIRTGGESVAPGEVEAVLAEHPAIAELAVVGIPDPDWGEVVCAVVVPRQGAQVGLEDLQALCAGRLARFKHPRRIERAASLPRTKATGQVQRALLVQQILAGC